MSVYNAESLVRNILDDVLALDLAKGKYVTFVDGDDRISPDLLKDNCTLAEKHAADIVFFGYTQCDVDENGNESNFMECPTKAYRRS